MKPWIRWLPGIETLRRYEAAWLPRDIFAGIVLATMLVPVGIAFGIDPVHLGIIFLANMELGFLAPPVGLNLLLSSYRFNKPILEVMRAVLPMLLVLLIGVLLITYFPPLTTFLPRLFK